MIPARTPLLVGALVLALLPAGLAAQTPCLPLGPQIAFCPDGSPWAGAESVTITGEDGIFAYELPPLYLEASTAWVDRAEVGTVEDALSQLRAELAAEAEADGDPAPDLRLREVLGTAPLTVTMEYYAEYFDGETYPLALMLVADGDDWLTVFLSSDAPMAEELFLDRARDLAGLLRPRAGD